MKFLKKYDEERYNYFFERYDKMVDTNFTRERLYKCQAYVYKNPETNELFLRSFSTIIAYYNPAENIIYDALRVEYTYTNTSNQHLAKFARYIREKYLHSMEVIPRIIFMYAKNGFIYTTER